MKDDKSKESNVGDIEICIVLIEKKYKGPQVNLLIAAV